MTAAVPASGSRGGHPSTSSRLLAVAGVDGEGADASVTIEPSRGREGLAFLLASAIVLVASLVCAVLGLLLATAIYGYGGL